MDGHLRIYLDGRREPLDGVYEYEARLDEDGTPSYASMEDLLAPPDGFLVLRTQGGKLAVNAKSVAAVEWVAPVPDEEPF